MSNGELNWIANFIWGIADDVLRDLYVRGKYRDVILPMAVLRRLDAVLEPTKQAVLDMKASLDKAGIVHQDAALRQAADQSFYNTSKFTLRDLRARASQQQLKADFEAYLDGYSPNVQEIFDNFEFRNQIPRLSKADALGSRIAEVHNGSSLFTGDAGQAESNIRRWIIEKDWLEAIVALPLNMFYNTGIATYIWVISNRKAEHRKGKVQLIDATQWFKPLRKNLGKKNCELSVVVEYEPDSELRDTEQVPLLEQGGIEAFIRREVLPYTPDAWLDESKTEIGYEISFARHFYKPQPLRTFDQIRNDILALEKETEGLVGQIIGSADIKP